MSRTVGGGPLPAHRRLVQLLGCGLFPSGSLALRLGILEGIDLVDELENRHRKAIEVVSVGGLPWMELVDR